ncbi:amelotin [Nycticebus coucang]|uniref:amelotin n=1 Tax=Nycticebus coucang TaxID=9470 RepID=UPI00234E0C3A|nr:amelotin [Nycticebus coucang]
MKTMILLCCLLGPAQSLPHLNPTLGLPPTKLAPDQAMLPTQQQPNQVFPSLSLIPLTQMLMLGSDLHLLSPAAGLAPGAQAHPPPLGVLNTQQLQSQMLPIFVAQLGAQGTILSSEELPVPPQIFTGLIIHPLFPGGVLPTGQARANADVQGGNLPAGTPEGHLTTPRDDDESGVTPPAGIQRGTSTAQDTTTEPPNGKSSQLGQGFPAMKVVFFTLP